MNKVVLIGRTTKDIELKYTTTQKPVVAFTLAVSRKFKNEQGEVESDFINCVAYGKTAENTSKFVGKGNLIGVAGEIRTRNYEKDGTKHYVTEVIADEIEFLQPKKQEETPKLDVDPFGDLEF